MLRPDDARIVLELQQGARPRGKRGRRRVSIQDEAAEAGQQAMLTQARASSKRLQPRVSYMGTWTRVWISVHAAYTHSGSGSLLQPCVLCLVWWTRP